MNIRQFSGNFVDARRLDAKSLVGRESFAG